MAAATTAPHPPPKPYELHLTIVSAKHLKNVNWKTGDLKPYVILWVDPDRRHVTKPDDSGSTRPVWNERFVLPLPVHPRDSILTLEIYHSKPSDTPKPLVGTLRFEIRELLVGSDPNRIRTFEINRPSGRPHGKIRLKLSVVERPVENYQTVPTPGYYYASAPPPHLPPHNYRGYSHSPYSSLPPPPPPPTSSPPPLYSYGPYSDPGYYSGYYLPPPPPRPMFERYGGTGPSAPVDYTPYDYHKRSGVNSGVGIGTGLAVGAVAGTLAGLTLEEEKVGDSVENELASTSRGDHYGDYRSDY